MNIEQPKPIFLSDYSAPAYRTEAVALEFDIRDGETVVHSTLTVQRQDAGATMLELDGEELELMALTVDGQTLSDNAYTLTETGLTLHGLGERHEVAITTRIRPEENTALEGLYRSSQMYCTQCEAQGFRKITYYQDRPDVLAQFRTTIVADGDRYPNLLSNGNKIAEEVREDGRTAVTWEDPFPKPSYLFALVAGNLEVLEDSFTTMSGREVTLQIFSEAHNIGQCGYAMDVLKRSMRWDEERFGREYDLDIFMIVAVEDFNMGAMENKGLNIFNTSCVLASPDTATDAAYQRVEAVVAHEYFHNWSGNRVTCRDWFQLSLKEGFTVFRDAEFSSDMNSAAVKRIEDVGFLRSVQFAEDAGPLAHPVRPASYIEISNFYTTTIYEKGAEVVRMYRTLLGDERFRAGSDLYFDRHDGSAATTDDFTDVMAEAGGVELSQFKRWYDQAGTPELVVEQTFGDGTLSLIIRQSCPPTPGQAEKLPFHMPIELGLLSSAGPLALTPSQIASESAWRLEEGGRTLLLELREAQATLNVTELAAQPVVSFLRGFSAPVKVTFVRPESELAFLAQHDTDGFVRWDSLQSLWVAHFGPGLTDEALPALVCEIARQTLTEDSPDALLLAATMLPVPDPNYLFEQLATVDVDAVLATRRAAQQAVAERDPTLWHDIYARFHTETTYQPDAAGMAARSLANLALANLVRTLPAEAQATAVQAHYAGADNLTDRRAALAVAVNQPGFPPSTRDELLNDFFARWRQEALVVDLWFSLQAQSGETSLDRMRALEQHEAFELKNPNRVRALFGAFGMYNHERFHARDGSGYVFLADAVQRLDARNPQLASRLATPLTRWRRYDASRQRLMRDALDTLAQGEMSKDLYEIVTKALAGA